MSTPTETQPPRQRTWIYVTAAVVLAALLVWALIAFNTARQTRQAEAKADEFIAAAEAKGYPLPDRDRVAKVLGDDGGAACANPNAALSRATLNSMLVNGATGPGARPIVSDSRAIKGQLLIIEVYCPDQLDEFEASVEDLLTTETGS